MRWRSGWVSIERSPRVTVSPRDPFWGCHQHALLPRPPPRCVAALSCAGVADRFSLLASQGQAYDRFAPAVPELLPPRTGPGPCFNRAASQHPFFFCNCGMLPEPRPLSRGLRWWRSPVPSGWLSHRGQSLVLPRVNYRYLTTWLPVTAKQLLLSLPAWEGG